MYLSVFVTIIMIMYPVIHCICDTTLNVDGCKIINATPTYLPLLKALTSTVSTKTFPGDRLGGADYEMNDSRSDSLISRKKTTPDGMLRGSGPGMNDSLDNLLISREKDSDSVDDDCDCVHGVCELKDEIIVCICDTNWAGDRCSIFCDCKPGETCHLVQGVIHICIKTNTEPSITSTINTDNGSQCYEVCGGNYTLRPLSERTCDSGWFCVKGVCVTQGGGNTECECDPGATGIQCENKCCKECLNGECFWNKADSTEMCNCYLNYSGSNCEILNPSKTHTLAEDPTWHYWVIGACAFALMLLICLMVIVPYCLWKHRVILVMKVVHYFQDYEDNDDRQWDVFISYKSTTSDETFVVETLFPKLEKELDFKANVHFRDFVAGETISNNIISAVEGSRRTILVISPSYVTSEFTKFEYQVAQQEMLKRKHRIIPILLEDITECKETMDPTLKVILGSVTYIEWPKIDSEKKLDKFWKRIELSMPKKKNRAADMYLSPVSNGIHTSTTPSSKLTDISSNNKSKYAVTEGSVYSAIDESKLNNDDYSVIDESKLNNEEVYDTLNESEMLTQVMKRQTEAEKKSKEGELLNVLKIDL